MPGFHHLWVSIPVLVVAHGADLPHVEEHIVWYYIVWYFRIHLSIGFPQHCTKGLQTVFCFCQGLVTYGCVGTRIGRDSTSGNVPIAVTSKRTSPRQHPSLPPLRTCFWLRMSTVPVAVEDNASSITTELQSLLDDLTSYSLPLSWLGWQILPVSSALWMQDSCFYTIHSGF